MAIDLIWYLIAGVASGVLVIFIYWYGRRKNWIGSIPIASDIIDPIVFSQKQREAMTDRRNSPIDMVRSETAYYIGIILIMVTAFIVTYSISKSAVDAQNTTNGKMITIVQYAIIPGILAVLAGVVWLYITMQASVLPSKNDYTKKSNKQQAPLRANWLGKKDNAETLLGALILLMLIPFMFVAWDLIGKHGVSGDLFTNGIPYMLMAMLGMIGLLLIVTFLHNASSRNPLFKWDSLLESAVDRKSTETRREQTETTKWMEQDMTFILITVVVLGSVFLAITSLVTYATSIASDPLGVMITLIINILVVGLTFMLWYYYWRRRRAGVTNGEPRNMTLHEFEYLQNNRWKNLTSGEKKMVNLAARYDSTQMLVHGRTDAELEAGIRGFKKLQGRTGTGDRQLNKDLTKKQNVFENEIDNRKDVGTWTRQ